MLCLLQPSWSYKEITVFVEKNWVYEKHSWMVYELWKSFEDLSRFKQQNLGRKGLNR
jgi:hypothetical protein